ncbi:chemotaxis protein CheB [Caenimonas aquaedulcis]|uniref:protein-glutamate methylesterase n=1 Tax=Caenimonas aquaedulcis TaxID=2793270 RepID=A0A931H3L4_9BURK|nr:chemotaxis protein CheB [Caenimonas aquaedulcis]MBG9387913.1 chemotaxis protein CheB [Caenimonas aquaedulcis]
MKVGTAPATSLPAGFRRAARMVAIGASAGGVEALLSLLATLPAGYALPIVTVLHLPEDRESLLTELFAKRCAMPTREAADKLPVEPGVLYVAPPGYHLLLESDMTFALSCDAPVRFSRPSIDVLFDSLADALGAEFAAVLLTGANDDGAQGLAHAGAGGALTVVQDPADAAVPDMPRAAIAARDPDFVLPLKDIRELMNHLEPCP